MTLLNWIWAIGVMAFALFLGGSVMLGHFPGLHSEIGLFRRLAAVSAQVSAEIGPVLTGVGILAAGVVLAVLSLFSNLRDDRGGFVDSDGDGGD